MSIRNTRPITNADEYIDSRDVIDRIDYLESEQESEGEDFDSEDFDELRKLQAFADQASDFYEWSFGVSFIRDDYFVDYAQEFARDIGRVDDNAEWPNCHIDWEAAARDLQMDYTSAEFDGETYWGRSG